MNERSEKGIMNRKTDEQEATEEAESRKLDALLRQQRIDKIEQQATQITILETTNQELFKNLERRVAENKKQEKQIKELEKVLKQCMGRLRVCDSDDDYEAYHASEKVITATKEEPK